MKYISTTLLSIFFAATVSATAHAAVSYDKELNCYAALISHSQNENFDFEESSGHTILLPGRRDGKSGLYVFTDAGAYFHALPEGPSPYYIELRIPARQPLFITYTVTEPMTNSGIVATLEMDPGLADKYVTITETDASDQAAQDVLMQELEKGVATVADTYRHTLHNKELKKSSPKFDYEAALNTCAKVTDSKLAQAVTSEKAALAKSH